MTKLQPIEDMGRYEILMELRKHAHPTWYQSLLEWETRQLRAYLTYCREGGDFPSNAVGRIYKTKGLGDCNPKPKLIGIMRVEIRAKKKPWWKRF